MKNIELSDDRKSDALKSIQTFFLKERAEEISAFQATLILDFILKDVGVYIYNQALTDAHYLMLEKAEELFALEKQPATEVRRR